MHFKGHTISNIQQGISNVQWKAEVRGQWTVKRRSDMSGQNPYTLNLYREPWFYALRSALCAMLNIQQGISNVQWIIGAYTFHKPFNYRGNGVSP